MQSCAVCGGVTIDAAGYCTQCRTFRGVPGQAGGYGQQVHPGPPGCTPPTSGGGHPASFPAPAVSPPPAGGRSYLVPLVALGSTLLVLVVAIVVVLVRTGGDDGGAVADPTRSAGAAATSAPATTARADYSGAGCVVGAWHVDSRVESVDDGTLGRVTFRGGRGARVVYKADGTGAYDYQASGTKFEGSVSGQTLTLEIRGHLDYRYEISGRRIVVTDLKSDATARFYLDGEPYGNEVAFDGAEDASEFTCTGDQLTLKGVLYETKLTRLS